MHYNFDEIIPRRNSYSQKWDLTKDPEVLPMWVADMDFQTARPILDALQKRVQHGIFGYAKVPDAYYDATINWTFKRFGHRIKKDWILPTTGVIPTLTAIIKALLQPGEKVIVQTPVYNGFFPAIANNNCDAFRSNLIYNNENYTIDYEDLENKVKDPAAKIFLLCNPHNPAGRVWTREELIRIGEICQRNNVIVISDEIHCDLVFEGHRHIPFASISKAFSELSITCTSPSKTFNLAGLQVANIIVENETIRRKIAEALRKNTISDIGPFAIDALIAAYNEGEDWLDQLLPYLYSNYQYTKEYCNTHLPQLKVSPLEATYLVWIDCKALNKTSAQLSRLLIEEGKVWLNDGTMYGGEAGEGFLRLNIACPKPLLIDGLERIQKVVESIS